jgi:hypothetical protein
METEAGLGVGVVGDLGAAIGVDVGVGLACRDYLDAARVEQRTKLDAEGEGVGFFSLGVELATGVVAAVRSIENHDEAGLGRGGNRRGLRGCGYRDGCREDGHECRLTGSEKAPNSEPDRQKVFLK